MPERLDVQSKNTKTTNKTKTNTTTKDGKDIRNSPRDSETYASEQLILRITQSLHASGQNNKTIQWVGESGEQKNDRKKDSYASFESVVGMSSWVTHSSFGSLLRSYQWENP